MRADCIAWCIVSLFVNRNLEIFNQATNKKVQHSFFGNKEKKSIIDSDFTQQCQKDCAFSHYSIDSQFLRQLNDSDQHELSIN